MVFDLLRLKAFYLGLLYNNQIYLSTGVEGTGLRLDA